MTYKTDYLTLLPLYNSATAKHHPYTYPEYTHIEETLCLTRDRECWLTLLIINIYRRYALAC